MKLNFGQYLVDVWLRNTKFNFGRDSEARFVQDFKFSQNTDVWLRF